jgi:hypothetical protein
MKSTIGLERVREINKSGMMHQYGLLWGAHSILTQLYYRSIIQIEINK